MIKSEEEKTFSEYLTVSEAAEYLGVSSATLRNWDRLGKLHAVRHPFNKYRLYEKKELQEVLSQFKK